MIDMATPKNQKKLRGLVGMITFYTKLWPQRINKMSILTQMTGKGKSVNGPINISKPLIKSKQ